MDSNDRISALLKSELTEFDNDVAKLVVRLVIEYENGYSAEEMFGEDLAARLKQICSDEELMRFCLRLYSRVAKDIAMCAQDYEFDRDHRQQTNTVTALLAEFGRKIRRRGEDGKVTNDELDPIEVLDRLIKAGWSPNSVDATGRTMLHDLVQDESLDCYVAADAITWLLEHGSNVNSTDINGVAPLHLAALTGHGIVVTLLEYGADRTLRTTSPAAVPLYSAHSLIRIPVGTTAYDLAKDSDLPEEVIDSLRCDAD